MIEYRNGDIFTARTDALVNPVNCVGVMGKGLALEFKRRWPENFVAYQERCGRGMIEPGRVFVFDTGASDRPRYIMNFPTKRHWRDASLLGDIEAGLVDLVAKSLALNLGSIAIPALGAGLGGLHWTQVRRRIEQAFAGIDEVAEMPVTVVIYGPR